MRNSTIRRVILLGAFAIMSILAVQSYWIMRQLDLSENQFRDKVIIALLETAKSVAKSSGAQLPNMDFIRQAASNYYIVNIDNPFKPEDLEFYLQLNLEAAGVKEDFEYGVFDCSSNHMVFGKLSGENTERRKREGRN